MTVRLVNQPSGGDIRNRIREAIRRRMELVAEEGVRLFEQATGTWSAATKPDFKVDSEINEHEIRIRIQLQAPTAHAVDTDISVFSLLDEGTDVRYAHMTPDFIAKTEPRSLIAGPGQGGFLELSYPLPGIEAREFSTTVAEILEEKMPEAIAKGLQEGLRSL